MTDAEVKSLMDTILKTDQVCYTYEGDDCPALDGLSLELHRGRKIACMGSNGSGKSTFFLCCNGIIKPDSGIVYFNGRPLNYSRKGLLDIRSKIGIVFQDPDNQLFSASVAQEISFGPMNLGLSETEARIEVENIMERLGITPFSHKPVHALSGGQKKLVAIADILVMHPELIIFDEPAASLDPFHTDLVHGIIGQAAKDGITVLMATHDVNYAWEWADEILVFHKGKLLADGTPKEIFSDDVLLKTAFMKPPISFSLQESKEECI